MGAVEIRGYWPALEVVATDRPMATPVPRVPPTTVAEWLGRAHEPWRRLLDEVCSPDVPRARRYAACDDLITLVSRHSFAAVGVLYPALAPTLERDEPGLVPALTADLVAASHVMVRLEHLMRGDTHHRASAFPRYCAELRTLLRAHTASEESLIPALGALDDNRRATLAAALHHAELRAPTRPHPHTLAHVTALRLAGPVEHVIDTFRDVMDNRRSVA
jgi:hypothetical protein